MSVVAKILGAAIPCLTVAVILTDLGASPTVAIGFGVVVGATVLSWLTTAWLPAAT